MSLESKLDDAGNGSGLEKKLSFGAALKKFTWWDWTKIIAVNAAGAALGGGLFGYGAINVLATTTSFIAANYLINRKKGFKKKSLQTEFVLGGTYTPIIYKLFEYVNILTPNPLAWMAGYALSLYPFTAITHGMKYLIDKYTPSSFVKGIFKGEPIKDIRHMAKDAVTDSVKASAMAALFLTLPVAAAHYLLPDQWLIASLFPIRTTYRYILERQAQKKEAYKSPSLSYGSMMPQAA